MDTKRRLNLFRICIEIFGTASLNFTPRMLAGYDLKSREVSSKNYSQHKVCFFKKYGTINKTACRLLYEHKMPLHILDVLTWVSSHKIFVEIEMIRQL